jgi:hypothetical protein
MTKYLLLVLIIFAGLLYFHFRKRRFSDNNIDFNLTRADKIKHPANCILITAKKNSNLITTADAIRECFITPEKAEIILDDFAAKGIAELTIKSNGSKIYKILDAESISRLDEF